MNTARLGTALLAGHVLVASISWTMGWMAGRLSERHVHRPAVWLGHLDLDLRDAPTRPYDWRRDGEAVEAHR